MRKTRRVRFAKKLTKIHYTRKSYYKGGGKPKKKARKKKSPFRPIAGVLPRNWNASDIIKYVENAREMDEISRKIADNNKEIKKKQKPIKREMKKMEKAKAKKAKAKKAKKKKK